jgi:hypothetical protein
MPAANKVYPALVYNPHKGDPGRFLMAYQQGPALIVQWLNHNGIPVDWPATVFDTASSDALFPALAYDTNRQRFLLSWAQPAPAPAGSPPESKTADIWMMLMDGDRVEPTVPPFKMGAASAPGAGAWAAPELPGSKVLPAQAFNPEADEYLLVWRHETTESKTPPLMGWRLRADDLKPIGDPYPLVSLPSQHQRPTLAYSAKTQHYLLAWSDDKDAKGVGWELYAQRLWGNGEPRGLPYPILPMAGNQLQPSLAYNAADGYHFITWIEPGVGGFLSLFGMRLNPNGRPFRAKVRVSFAPSDKSYPALSATQRDAFVVVWSDAREPVHKLWGHRLNGNGIPLQQDFLIEYWSVEGPPG